MVSLSEKINFSAEEDKILELWKKIDAFKRSLELTKDKPEYTFYDGPPFATGLPHYGHILAGTIKDIVTRYATQTGHYVSRRFGWDCHGLPVEYEIDKKLNISGREQVLAMGIDKYNAECRAIVTRYCAEWETIVTRLGRWIDFKNDYRTMEPWYMESVWWVFSELWKKNLVYRSFRVMPYSTACNTPLSNFEANLNYKEDTVDPAVVVSFPILSFPASSSAGGDETSNTSFVAWTTTPWTLPSNLALCVNSSLDYVCVKDLKSNHRYILMEARLTQLYIKYGKKDYKGGEFEIVRKYKGKDLIGATYEPLFNYFVNEYGSTAFRVVADDYVKDDAGTGIVHQAPAFGEDDYRVCTTHGIINKDDGRLPCPVDANGNFSDEVPDFKGIYVKKADDAICAYLKSKGKLVNKASITHSYPFCWRSDTPLIYRAVPSWFVRVESIKERLLAANDKTYWVPSSVKEGRFHNWLRDARDWNISRNRYWGTPLPIWTNETYTEFRVFSSIAELEAASGQKITDLHREFIDHLTVPSASGTGVLRRIDEVFDCWFESGSMPYAQIHYPFENAQGFTENRFPADFIAEGLDQTRGWFYTLMVLSTALFDKPAFKNLIVNGLVLAEDGKKMSKRLKNYPDPMDVVNRYGADALRLYLINSPVVRADPLRFKESGVLEVVKELFLPWYNALRFMCQNAGRLATATGQPFVADPNKMLASTNAMDRWVVASVQGLIKFIRAEMEAYRLYTVVPRLVAFINDLTNWYVRLNRRRLKGGDGDEEAVTSLCTLHEVLLSLSSLMAPFTPFLTELHYQNLRQFMRTNASDDPTALGTAESIHFTSIPHFKPEFINEQLEARVRAMLTAIELGRTARDRRVLSLKTPVRNVTIIHPDTALLKYLEELQDYIAEELNTLSVNFTSKEEEWATFTVSPNMALLGKRLGKDLKAATTELAGWSAEQIRQYMTTRKATLTTGNIELSGDDIKVGRVVRKEVIGRFECLVDESSENPLTNTSLLVAVDTLQDEVTQAMGAAREIANRVQKLRKHGGCQVGDNLCINYSIAPLSPVEWEDYVAGRAAKQSANQGGGNEDEEETTTTTTSSNAKPTGTTAAATSTAPIVELSNGLILPITPNQPIELGNQITDIVRTVMMGTAVEVPSRTASIEAAKNRAQWVQNAIFNHYDLIRKTLRMPFLPDVPSLRPKAYAVTVASAKEIIAGALVTLTITRACVRFNPSEAVWNTAFNNDTAIVNLVRSSLAVRDLSVLSSSAGSSVALTLDKGVTVTVPLTKEADLVYFSPETLFCANTIGGETLRNLVATELNSKDVVERLRTAVSPFA